MIPRSCYGEEIYYDFWDKPSDKIDKSFSFYINTQDMVSLNPIFEGSKTWEEVTKGGIYYFSSNDFSFAVPIHDIESMSSCSADGRTYTVLRKDEIRFKRKNRDVYVFESIDSDEARFV